MWVYTVIMRIFKTFILLFICFSLPMGGAIAMPCCSGNSMSQMQADNGKSDIPCHQVSTKKNDSKNHNSCEKCKSCAATSAIISTDEHFTITFTNTNHNEYVTGFISYNPVEIYFPPKRIS